MDGGGRLDQPLMRSGPAGVEEAGAPLDEPAQSHARIRSRRSRRRRIRPAWWMAYQRFGGRWIAKYLRFPPPRGVGIAASVLLLVASLGYGVVQGQHIPDIIGWFKDARDPVADAVGFRIAAISLTGA